VTHPHYGARHRAERAAVLAASRVCHWCGGYATTGDHEPAIALHRHIEGSGCCRQVPACVPCNSKRGAWTARARRRPQRASRRW
jgi:hypothetical protein